MKGTSLHICSRCEEVCLGSAQDAGEALEIDLVDNVS